MVCFFRWKIPPSPDRLSVIGLIRRPMPRGLNEALVLGVGYRLQSQIVGRKVDWERVFAREELPL
jgi:hypothetical protein